MSRFPSLLRLAVPVMPLQRRRQLLVCNARHLAEHTWQHAVRPNLVGRPFGCVPTLLLHITAQAQAAYELATSAFTLGKQRLVCDGFTRKCRARNEQSHKLGRKAG
jgi:hypothetical protein